MRSPRVVRHGAALLSAVVSAKAPPLLLCRAVPADARAVPGSVPRSAAQPQSPPRLGFVSRAPRLRVPPGGVSRWRFAVVNGGRGPARDVTLSAAPPPGLRPSSTSPPCAWRGGRLLRCRFGTLKAGAHARGAIDARVTGAGTRERSLRPAAVLRWTSPRGDVRHPVLFPLVHVAPAADRTAARREDRAPLAARPRGADHAPRGDRAPREPRAAVGRPEAKPRGARAAAIATPALSGNRRPRYGETGSEPLRSPRAETRGRHCAETAGSRRAETAARPRHQRRCRLRGPNGRTSPRPRRARRGGGSARRSRGRPRPRCPRRRAALADRPFARHRRVRRRIGTAAGTPTGR